MALNLNYRGYIREAVENGDGEALVKAFKDYEGEDDLTPFSESFATILSQAKTNLAGFRNIFKALKEAYGDLDTEYLNQSYNIGTDKLPTTHLVQMIRRKNNKAATALVELGASPNKMTKAYITNRGEAGNYTAYSAALDLQNPKAAMAACYKSGEKIKTTGIFSSNGYTFLEEMFGFSTGLPHADIKKMLSELDFDDLDINWQIQTVNNPSIFYSTSMYKNADWKRIMDKADFSLGKWDFNPLMHIASSSIDQTEVLEFLMSRKASISVKEFNFQFGIPHVNNLRFLLNQGYKFSQGDLDAIKAKEPETYRMLMFPEEYESVKSLFDI